MNKKPKLNALQHPLGIEPFGNSFKVNAVKCRRKTSLGKLSVLDDALLVAVLECFGPMDLAKMATTSKVVYAVSYHDEFWRHFVLNEMELCFNVARTWRDTWCVTKGYARNVQDKVVLDGFYSDYFFQSYCCANIPLDPSWLQVQNVPIESKLSVDEFKVKYEIPNVPVVIRNAMQDWKAMKKWTMDHLMERFPNEKLCAGGYFTTLAGYKRYADVLKDDQPLYVFDKRFAQVCPSLEAEFSVPEYFNEDLFQVLGKDRPDYRWLIIGPTRSGSSFHVDPNGTSAWNAVVEGSKKWILFPPSITPPGVVQSVDGGHVSTSVSLVEWFMNYYDQAKTLGAKECIVRKGEVIFVPHGWWHMVLNLEDTIAITQNYVSRANVNSVLHFLQKKSDQVSGYQHENLYDTFTTKLTAQYPDIKIPVQAKPILDVQKDVSFSFNFAV